MDAAQDLTELSIDQLKAIVAEQEERTRELEAEVARLRMLASELADYAA